MYIQQVTLDIGSREGELLEGGDGDTADNGEESGVHGQGEELPEEQGAEEGREEGLSRLITITITITIATMVQQA